MDCVPLRVGYYCKSVPRKLKDSLQSLMAWPKVVFIQQFPKVNASLYVPDIPVTLTNCTVVSRRRRRRRKSFHRNDNPFPFLFLIIIFIFGFDRHSVNCIQICSVFLDSIYAFLISISRSSYLCVFKKQNSFGISDCIIYSCMCLLV